MLRNLSKVLTPRAARALTSKPAGVRFFSDAKWTPPQAEGDVEFEFARPFKGFNLEAPESKGFTNKEELMTAFETMAYYRRFEIVCDTLYKARSIRGFCHLYDGQEAVVVGMEQVLKMSDSVITAYRDHCHQLARGDTGGSVMSELLGKETGCSRGKGGSMHLYYPENNFFGGNGIVGAQAPLGAGLAFAHKYRNDGGVCVAAYGDGASNQGQIFEVYNMAKIWKLPVIFLCENNDYAMGTSADRHTDNQNFYTRGSGQNVPGLWADGMDVVAVKTAFQFATDFCRNGNGPIVMEVSTYRYHGHSMSDPGISYRSRDEVDAVRKERDCIDAVKNKLLDQGWADAKQLKAIEKKVRKQVDQDVAFAQGSKELPVDQMFEDIYTITQPPFVRHVDHQYSQYNNGEKNFYRP